MSCPEAVSGTAQRPKHNLLPTIVFVCSEKLLVITILRQIPPFERRKSELHPTLKDLKVEDALA